MLLVNSIPFNWEAVLIRACILILLSLLTEVSLFRLLKISDFANICVGNLGHCSLSFTHMHQFAKRFTSLLLFFMLFKILFFLIYLFFELLSKWCLIILFDQENWLIKQTVATTTINLIIDYYVEELIESHSTKDKFHLGAKLSE